jgi:hypothetical protein
MNYLNDDSNLNVLDISILANCVLQGNCSGYQAAYCVATNSTMNEASIYYNTSDESIYINSDVSITGFQFEMVGDNFNVLGVNGGAAASTFDFINKFENFILGVSLTAVAIPPMDGVLVSVDVDNSSSVSLSKIILSDSNGCEICVSTECNNTAP